MLDGAGKVRVMDFGLAAVGPVAEIRAGTPAYMAPEQLLGREVTARSDIFALGLVLYELFTGRRAFTATTHRRARRAAPERAQLTPPADARQRTRSRDRARDPAVPRSRSRRGVRRRRWPSAAALPGGDPLAAALAAGETPSPEMVAAAGEGAGLSARVAVPVLVAILAGIAAPLRSRCAPARSNECGPNTPQMCWRRKRETRSGRSATPTAVRDEAYGFLWDDALIEYARSNEKPAPRWDEVLTRRPSPLIFWYRQSPVALTGLQFHHDLLTPGIVTTGGSAADPVGHDSRGAGSRGSSQVSRGHSAAAAGTGSACRAHDRLGAASVSLPGSTLRSCNRQNRSGRGWPHPTPGWRGRERGPRASSRYVWKPPRSAASL